MVLWPSRALQDAQNAGSTNPNSGEGVVHLLTRSFARGAIFEVLGGPNPGFPQWAARVLKDGFKVHGHDGRRGGYPGLRGPSRSLPEAAKSRLESRRRGQDPRESAGRQGGVQEDHYEAASTAHRGAVE